MSVYTEYNVKSDAMTKFLSIVTEKNNLLGTKLTKHRDVIYEQVIKDIQQVGITAYARDVLARRSESRKTLEELIEERV